MELAPPNSSNIERGIPPDVSHGKRKATHQNQLILEQQIHDVLSHITCPCLAIMAYPNRDHHFQRIIDQRLSLLPDVTEYKIDASHHLQLSHPDEAAAIINEWLASHI